MVTAALRLFVVVIIVTFSHTHLAYAAAVSSLTDMLSTMKESTAANHTITFTINDSWDATDTVIIDFPNTFNTAGFASNEPEDYDVTDDGVDVTIVANGSCSANSIEITTVNSSTDTFTFTLCAGSSAIASGSVIVVEVGTHATTGSTGNDQIVNQTAAENATDPLVTIAGTFGGTGTLALEIVADNDATVSVNVLERISCSFSGLSVTFPDATGSVITATPDTTITAGTNAPNGLTVSVYDAGNGTNPGLYKSSAPTYLIGSASATYSNTATLSSNVDGFGIQGSATQGDTGSATLTIASRYNQTGSTVGGLEALSGNAQVLSSTSGPASNTVTTVTHKMSVSLLAPAGAYSDTLTYVCTGGF